jgi:hypothetical protein
VGRGALSGRAGAPAAALAVALAAIGWAGPVRAESPRELERVACPEAEGKRVIVQLAPGAAAPRPVAVITAALCASGEFAVVSDEELAAALAELGFAQPWDGFRQVAEALEVSALITVRRQGQRITVTLRDGSSGERVVRRFPQRGPRALDGPKFWEAFRPALARAQPPAPPPAGADPDLEIENAGDDIARPDRPPARSPRLDAAVGSRFVGRTLRYTDDLFEAIPTYELLAAPALAIELAAYPAALAGRRGPLARLGVTASFERVFGLSSEGSGLAGRTPTSSYAYRGGLVAHLPLGPLEGTLGACYGNHVFRIITAGAGGVPAVAYRHLCLGGAIRWAQRRFALVGEGAYLHVFSPGQIGGAAYFPRSQVAGVEGALVVAVPIGASFEVRAGAGLRRFFYTMNPEPGDPYIAGGAVDQYPSAIVRLAYRLGP